jgi:4-amino-4-deoxy-L-arabinose transferase-like glycosyltransferase
LDLEEKNKKNQPKKIFLFCFFLFFFQGLLFLNGMRARHWKIKKENPYLFFWNTFLSLFFFFSLAYYKENPPIKLNRAKISSVS